MSRSASPTRLKPSASTRIAAPGLAAPLLLLCRAMRRLAPLSFALALACTGVIEIAIAEDAFPGAKVGVDVAGGE